MEIEKKAFAKINLTLDVLNKREDGYHNIVSLMQSVSLCDTVTILATDAGIDAAWNLDEATGESNTAYRAAERMLDKYGVSGGVKIYIDKKIPVSAGLGGGSADAAAVIEGINELYGINAPFNELISLGAEIGADVPFCLTKGAAIAEGIGERLAKLDARMKCSVVLVKPGVSVSTKTVYAMLDALSLTRRPNIWMAADAVKAGDIKNLGRNLYNVMELVTAEEHPVILNIKRDMARQGACGALMSGSGPTVYGIFSNVIQAKNAYGFFANKYKDFEVLISEFYYPGEA